MEIVGYITLFIKSSTNLALSKRNPTIVEVTYCIAKLQSGKYNETNITSYFLRQKQ